MVSLWKSVAKYAKEERLLIHVLNVERRSVLHAHGRN
jgi:hypothetical protein